ncbi:MAG: alginate lyase family protein, partial [Candidatus Limnocylindrales bacterium]
MTIDGADPSTPPRSTRSPRRGLTATVVVVALVALGIDLSGSLSRGRVDPSPAPTTGSSGTAPTTGSSTGPTDTSTPSVAGPTLDHGYLATRAEVLERARLARDGVQPYRAAVDDLLMWAHGAVRRDPRPAERLRIRGTEGPFVDDTAAAYGLALAYLVSGDRDYAAASTRFIMAWVDTTTTTRDTCPDDGACQTSLIISRTVPGFVFAADLLAGPDGLTQPQDERFRAWLRDIMLPTASELGNNWGDAGTFTRVVLTDYLGDTAGFEAAVAKWRTLLDDVGADGHIPAEVARERAGLGYTQEALDYKVAAAWIAGRRGVDL